MANRGKRSGPRASRMTFRQLCDLSRWRANRNLMQRARRASRLAKAVRGKARRQLYDVKHRCIRRLVSAGGVRLEADHRMYPGLLSVAVDGEGRLHTHEAWMTASLRSDHEPAASPRSRLAWWEVNN